MLWKGKFYIETTMKSFIILLVLFLTFESFSQKNDSKNNNIFFYEISSGGSFGDGGGGNAAFSINYQTKEHLFTYKYSGTFKIDPESRFLIAFIPFAYIFLPLKLEERALLYGKRYLRNEVSYSFSAGISYTDYHDEFVDYDRATETGRFIGFPFEINARRFNREKSKLKLIGIIPIGKSNGFGMAGGIKLFGSLSKKSYIGIGLTMGFGYYKNYN